MPPASGDSYDSLAAADPAIFRLTEEDIHAFQVLIQETTGLWMTAEDAGRRANGLLALTRIIIGAFPEDPAAARVLTSSHLRDFTRQL